MYSKWGNLVCKKNYKYIPPPRPIGRPVKYHITNSSDQTNKARIEYGNISEINVPMPAFLSYFSAKTTINAKKDISGVMTFVTESPTRKATCVKAGS